MASDLGVSGGFVVAVVRQVDHRDHLGERALDNPLTFEYTNRLILGRACLRATSMAGEARGLAVWNGRPGDGLGGTATAIARWRRSGGPTR